MSKTNILIPPEAIDILSCSYETINIWRHKNYKVPFWKLFYNSKGISEVFFQGITGQRRVSLPDMTIILIPPNISFSCYNSSTIAHFNLTFSISGLPLKADNHIYPFPFEGELKENILKLQSGLNTELSHKIDLASLVLNRISNDHLSSVSKDIRIQSAIIYMEQNLSVQLSNSFMAKKAGMSVNGFARLFKEETRCTLYDYQLHMRLNYSAKNLLYSDSSIEAIALDCGFTNRFHFSKTFKKGMFMTPVQYRNIMPK